MHWSFNPFKSPFRSCSKTPLLSASSLVVILLLINVHSSNSINWLSSSRTTVKATDDFERQNLLDVKELTFYRDYYTIGSKVRPQLQCHSRSDDDCRWGPKFVVCKNNFYKDYSKVNETLSWTCEPDFLVGYYYIEPGSEQIDCEELGKTDTARYVVSGSCSLSFRLDKNTTYRNLLFLLCGLIVLGLVIGLVFYLRRKRRSYEMI